MEGCHINQIVKGTPRRGKGCFQIIKRKLHLSGEIGLGGAIGAASYLTRNKQQIAGTDGGRITVFFIKSMTVSGENRFALDRKVSCTVSTLEKAKRSA